MILQSFEQLEKDLAHEIFGSISIYKDPKTSIQYFTKKLPFDQNFISLQENLQKREALNSPTILTLVDQITNHEDKEVLLIFEYPQTPLSSRKTMLKNLGERINFLLDILSALNDLQSVNMIHGNLTE